MKLVKPELRFKDENGNEYPKWVTQKIKELGNVYTGNTPSKKQSTYWNSNNYIWITPTDIKNKKNLKSSEYMLSNEGFKKARQLPKNTLLITCIASIGKNAILREEGSCNQQINALVPSSDKNVDFLYYAFEKVSKYMKRIAGKTATQIVNKSTFENISIEVPNFEEQLKIGRFFSKLDRQIELEEEKLELLEQQKHGYVQKIFSQELRFKDKNGQIYPEWKLQKLKNVLEFSNLKTTKEDEYPVLTSSRNGLLFQSDYYKDGKTFANSNIGYFILPRNYITYRSRSDDGKFRFNLNKIIDVGIISKYYPVFKGKGMDQYYLTLHLNYQLKKEYIKFATGTSQLVLSQKNLQEISTELPS